MAISRYNKNRLVLPYFRFLALRCLKKYALNRIYCIRANGTKKRLAVRQKPILCRIIAAWSIIFRGVGNLWVVRGGRLGVGRFAIGVLRGLYELKNQYPQCSQRGKIGGVFNLHKKSRKYAGYQ